MNRILTAVCAFVTLPVMAVADSSDQEAAAAGERIFRKCQACHMVGADAVHKTGPVLNGVVGRPVAVVQDFGYSDTLRALGAEGKVWTPEELMEFLAKPKDYAKGTKMTFAGLRKEEERAHVIAYLATFIAEDG